MRRCLYLDYFELRIRPRRQTSVAAFMRVDRAVGRGGCAAGYVPPSPILIRVHTSFRGVAEQCLPCVRINHGRWTARARARAAARRIAL